MKLPNAERAVVEREKIADYLLNPEHPDNGGKAAFFLALGYNRDDWPSLPAALRRLAVATEAAKKHGNGARDHVCSGWWHGNTRRQDAGRPHNLDC